MKKLLFIIILFVGSLSFVTAQNVEMTGDDGTTVTTCSGTFTIGSYTPGETYTVTICSDDPLNRHITITNGSYNFPDGTELCIYDGDDATADQLACWGPSTNGTVAVFASNTNETGCITLVFNSTVGGATFTGDIACQFQCPAPLLVDVVSAVPALVNEGGVNYANVCWDEENNQSEDVTFTAAGTYPSGAGYTLDDANVTFTWNFNDGSPEESGLGLTTVTHNFPTRQGYTITVTIEDSQGCFNTNSATQRVRVSRSPIWSSASTVDPAEICMGETVEMCAAYGTSEWNSSIVPEVADTVSLPDGSGVCYNSNLMQNQFLPGQTLESVSDLNAICMSLEHSFLGDLTIDIQCPSGQSVQLEAQGGSGTFLGEPIDNGYSDNNEVPGVGYWYCITPTGSETLAEAAASVSTIPAGDYASYESLSGLEGCTLNGQWTITICDNWSSDDGYIFGWYLDFNEDLFPDMWAYTPDYTPTNWYGMYGAVLDDPTDEDCVTGTYMTTDNPSVNTDQPFIFTLTDDFGCEHDTAMYVTVYDENNPSCCVQPTPDPGPNSTACGLTFTMAASNPVSGNNGYWQLVSGPGEANFVDAIDPQTEVTVTVPGIYQFSWTEQFYGNAACETTETMTVEFEEVLDPTLTDIADMCTNGGIVEIEAVDFGTLSASPAIPGIDQGFFDADDLTPGTTYTITNTLGGTCYTSPSDNVSFTVYDEIQIINFNDQTCIPGDLYEVEFTVVGSNGSTPVNNYFVNSAPQTNANFYATHTSATAYAYTVTDVNGCSSIELEGFRDCGCPSAGTMSSLELVDLCGNACTGSSVSHEGNDFHPDGLPYVLGYIIHDGDINNPIAYNDSEPDFCRNTLGLSYGTIYYVTAVVSHDENSNGDADPTDGCYSAAQGTPVRWMQIPTPDAGVTNDTCGLVMPLHGSEIPVGMVGYWSSTCDFVGVMGTDYHDANMVVQVPSDAYGDCLFTWNVVNGQCVGSDDVVMTFNQTPIPFAGNDTIVCGTEIDLTVDNSIPGTTFQWSGNASFNPATGANTTVTVSNPGTYGFILTEFNGADCYDQDEIVVTFIPGPQPVITNTIDTVCGTQVCLDVDNVRGEGVWTAYDDGGVQITPFFDDAFSPNACATIQNYSGNYNNVDFVWTETNEFQGVQCTNSVTQNIVFAKVPNAFVGDDYYEDVCGNVYTFDADTTGTSWAYSYWQGKETVDLSFDDNSLPDATVTINPLSAYGDSAHVEIPFQWVVRSGGGCFDIDTMWVTFYKEPVANAGLDDSICGLQYDLEAFYSLPDTTNYSAYGIWSNPAGNPGTVNFLNTEDNGTQVNVGTPGTYRFVWRENNSMLPGCHSTDTVEITFKENPVIDAGDDFDVCGNTTTLSATTSGFDLTWQPVGGAVFEDYNAATTGVTFGGYGEVTFSIIESNEECVDTDEVTVHFWRRPSATHLVDEADTTVCGRVFPRLRAENPGGGVVGNWISVPANGVTFYNQYHIDTVSVLNYDHYTFWWTESTGPDDEGPDFCSDTSEPFTVHFIEIPDANAGTDTVFCGYSGNLNAEVSVNNGNSSGTWFNVSSNITFEEPGNPETLVTSDVLTTNNPSYDNFELVWTEDNYGCTNSDTVVVGFARIPEAIMTIIPPRCEGEPASIRANEDSLANYNWQWNGGLIDSIWPENDQGGKYRHLVYWPNDDTSHIVSLSVENYWGCVSPIIDTIIFEPYRPTYKVVTYPDTCALGKGAFEFLPDTTTEYPSFSWFDVNGEEQPVPVGDTIFNIPAGTYEGTHQYLTFNNTWSTQYINLYGTDQCVDAIEFDIDTAGVVKAEFVVSAATDMNALVAPNAEVIFDNLSDGDDVRTSCTWYFGDGESENTCDEQVIHVYTEPNECYEPYLVVRVRDLPECRDTAFMECITIDDMSELEIPNIFTPNGDNMNDFFQVRAQTLQTFRGIIVNRWGRTIYEWTDYETMEAGWDGKLSGGSNASPGVYYYIIKATGMDGVEYDESGPFHLVREKQ